MRKRYKCKTCNPNASYYRNDENTVWMKEISFENGIQKFKCPKCEGTTELDYVLLKGIF